MSEPRRLNTGDAQRTVYHAGDAQRTPGAQRPASESKSSVLSQEQYEEARRRAQAAAAQSARTRRTQPIPRVQQSEVDAYHAAQAQAQAQARAQAQAQLAAQPQTPAQELPMAQRQARALRRKAEMDRQRAAAAPAPHRTVRRAPTPGAGGAQVKQLDLNKTQAQKAHYDVNSDAEFEARQARRAQKAAAAAQAPAMQEPAAQPAAQPAVVAAARSGGSAAQHSSGSAARTGGHGRSGGAGGSGGGGKGPGGGSHGSNGEKGGGPHNKNGKKKKRGTWWKVLLGTLLAIVLIFGGTIALIMHAIAPEAGSISINQLINTPKEYQGKEFNILITGVDRSSAGTTEEELAAGATNDSDVNDGMTDMILYLHFNNETGEVKMLQVPRDTMVTTDRSVSGNYRINAVAKTQGSDGNNNMAALCELFSDQYKLPVDGYITIRLEMLVQLVDQFGGVELNVPIEMDYNGSHLNAGYQTLKGDACEFLLRARHIYPNGDIGRLNMQRQFYGALFRKLKSINNIWDVAKLTPAVVNYMETSLNVSDLVSFAVSMLRVDSSKIMLCQMPVITGPLYYDQALVYPARQQDADLLNTYFRENTGAVDASALNLCDDAVDLNGYAATDPNVQFMNGIMAEQSEAQQNNNLDGSHAVEYTESTAASTDPASSEPAA